MTATVTTPPRGWIAAGSHPASYEMSVFSDFCHSGTQCARLHAVKAKIDGFGTLMQTVKSDAYKGKRIQLSAWVKSENVTDWAGLWMRIDAGREYVAFDNMQDRPIKGDTGWTRYHVVLDVPQTSTLIAFGLLLQGTGTVWLDDVEIIPVEAHIPSTDSTYSRRSCGIQYQNKQATNLDFSQGIRQGESDSHINEIPVGWFKQSSGEGDVTIGLEESAGAPREAFIRVDGQGSGSLFQAVSAEPYAGKRLKLSAMIKTDEVEGTASLFYRSDVVRHLSVTYDHMEGRELTGTNDWEHFECVIDIPTDSDNIYIGGHVVGSGTAWFRDFELTVVPDSVKTTGKHGKVKAKSDKNAKKKHIHSEPVNLSFDEGGTGTRSGAHQLPFGWMATGSHPEDYKMCIDKSTKLDGAKCALLEFIGVGENGFGTMMQMIEADYCLGKQIKLTAKIKSEAVGWAALWMRVDGENGEILGFDNMQKNPINDTTDWTEYEIILDVPLAAQAVAFGVLVSGQGKVWFTNVALEETEGDAPSTDVKEILDQHRQPVNMNFED